MFRKGRVLCLNNFEASEEKARVIHYVEINWPDKEMRKPEHVLQSANARGFAWSLTWRWIPNQGHVNQQPDVKLPYFVIYYQLEMFILTR